jgi:hypothetical protein
MWRQDVLNGKRLSSHELTPYVTMAGNAHHAPTTYLPHKAAKCTMIQNPLDVIYSAKRLKLNHKNLL